MATEIKVWQIEEGKLIPIETSMAATGRTEKEDLEQWIKSNPEILGDDILIIGEQVPTKSGPLDFLGIDKTGNTIIVELKRDRLPRDALSQAIDYAFDVQGWDVNKLSEECKKFSGQPLEIYINENLENVNLEEISLNQTQRILLVGTSVEEPLQRMIEWLSDNYGVGINAYIFKYIKTKSGDELIAKTVIISEEVERERSKKQQKQIPMSDEPGNYEEEELRTQLLRYFSEKRDTPRRIKDFLLPLCLDHEPVTREEIIKEFVEKGEATDESQAGRILTTISRELGIKQRDYLRQVIRYEKNQNQWWKDNYQIEERYKDLMRELLRN